MAPLNQKTVQALFRNKGEGLWVGGVHMMNRFYEYIPFSLDDERYAVEFNYPRYLSGIGFFTDQLFNAQDGGIFIPQRGHRTMKLRSISSQGEIKSMQAVDVKKILDLAHALFQVVETYCKRNAFAGQFFFEAETDLGDFIRNTLPAQPCVQGSALTLVFHDEVAKPFYGFSVSFKLTA